MKKRFLQLNLHGFVSKLDQIFDANNPSNLPVIARLFCLLAVAVPLIFSCQWKTRAFFTKISLPDFSKKYFCFLFPPPFFLLIAQSCFTNYSPELRIWQVKQYPGCQRVLFSFDVIYKIPSHFEGKKKPSGHGGWEPHFHDLELWTQ